MLQVRHGGLLGLKYLIAVCEDFAITLLPTLLPVLKTAFVVSDCNKLTNYSLSDDDDDVRAVAAESLLPLAHYIMTHSVQEMQSLLSLLWDALEQLDDLTASTAHVMRLLGTFDQLTFADRYSKVLFTSRKRNW